MQQSAKIVSRAAWIWTIVALAPTAATAGPLGFQDLGLVDRAQVLAECGSCGFITIFENPPVQTDSWQSFIISGCMALLALIGWIGVSLRVRVRR